MPRSINWTKIRSQFPALKKYTYLNAAEMSPTPLQVRKAAEKVLKEIEDTGVLTWRKWEERVSKAREHVARYLSASKAEIAFTLNTGHGMNIVADILKGKGEVLTMEDEYPTSTIPWIHRGFPVRFIKPINATYPIAHIEKFIGNKTRILVTSHIQYKTGFRQNLTSLGKLCKKHNLILVVNATQSAGAFPINVKETNIDFLVFGTYKWTLGGLGTGVLYIKKALLDKYKLPMVGSESVKDWCAMDNKKFEIRKEASALEVGAGHFPNICALGASLKMINLIGINNITNKILELNEYLVTKVRGLGLEIITPLARKYRSGITIVKAENAEKIVEKLRSRNVIVSKRGEGIRIALHFYNNTGDIDIFIRELSRVIQ